VRSSIILFLTLAILPLIIQAGYQFDIWILFSDCSGDASIHYDSNNNDCGISGISGKSAYTKQTWDISSGDYHVLVFSDNGCTSQSNDYRVSKDNVGKCVANSGSIINIGSTKFQIIVNCFPAESTIQTTEHQKLSLSQLKVGNSIITANGESEVYSFLDYQLNVTLLYLELFYMAENGDEGKIAISHEHNILAQRGEKSAFVQAKDVQVGDKIFKSVNGENVPVTVTKVGSGFYKGAIAPATMDGTMVVNDIVVSSYAAINHDVAHSALAPLRWGYWVSPKLVNSDEFNGMHPYAKVLYEMFSNWVHHPSSFYATPTLDSQ